MSRRQREARQAKRAGCFGEIAREQRIAEMAASWWPCLMCRDEEACANAGTCIPALTGETDDLPDWGDPEDDHGE